jgi:hypothetical protein
VVRVFTYPTTISGDGFLANVALLTKSSKIIEDYGPDEFGFYKDPQPRTLVYPVAGFFPLQCIHAVQKRPHHSKLLVALGVVGTGILYLW